VQNVTTHVIYQKLKRLSTTKMTAQH